MLLADTVARFGLGDTRGKIKLCLDHHQAGWHAAAEIDYVVFDRCGLKPFTGGRCVVAPILLNRWCGRETVGH